MKTIPLDLRLLRSICLSVFLGLLLAGCGSKTVKPEATEQPQAPETPLPQAPASQPATPSEPATTPPAKGSGGYYKDDGPEANPPADIANVPDAMPRGELPNPKLNRPYTALGNQYKPMKAYEPYRERGIASWYGKRFHGNKTASGERYDMYQMTAAHTTLPIPSYARITNIANGRSVVVKVNDRGPFHKERLIDLSYAAAYKIGLLVKGSAEVEVEAIDTRETATKTPSSATSESTSNAAIETASTSNNSIKSSASGVYVQVAAFKDQINADKLREKLQSQNLSDNVPVESWYNTGTYRVRIGPYSERKDAEQAVKLIKQKLGISAIIVNQK